MLHARRTTVDGFTLGATGSSHARPAETAACTNAEPSGWAGSGLSGVLLCVSGRPKRQFPTRIPRRRQKGSRPVTRDTDRHGRSERVSERGDPGPGPDSAYATRRAGDRFSARAPCLRSGHVGCLADLPSRRAARFSARPHWESAVGCSGSAGLLWARWTAREAVEMPRFGRSGPLSRRHPTGTQALPVSLPALGSDVMEVTLAVSHISWRGR